MAILAVVFFHAGVPFVPGGFVGVDVFFVISGYLIAGIIKAELEAGTFSLAGFYERRVRRILPALVVMVAVALVAGWVILLPSDFEQMAISALAALFSVSNVWFWRDANNYFAAGNDETPLLHTWSLGVEEQFYLVVPLLLLAVFRWRRSWLPAVAVVAVAALFIVGAYVAWVRPAAGFYLVPFRAWELGLGVLLAVVRLPVLRARWLREAAAAAGMAAIVGAAIVYTDATPFPGVGSLLPTLGAAALIHAGSSGGSIAGRLLSIRPMVMVGLISYSLYLWHWPILVLVRLVLVRADLSPATVASAVAVSFLAAAISWRFIERPFRRRTWLTRRKVAWLSIGAVGAVAIAAAAVVAGRGLPERFSPDLQPMVALLETPGRVQTACTEPNLTEDGSCRFGAAGVEPTVLLWGDSHARAILPAVDRAAQIAGLAGYYAWSPSCPPLLGVLRLERSDCLGFNDAVVAELRRNTAIDTVILGARWARWQLNDARLPTDHGPPIPDHADDPALPGEPGPEGVMAFGLNQTLDTLVAEGYSVVILGTTPEFPVSVPEALIAERRWGIRFVATDAAAYAERNRIVLPLFEELARRPGVKYVPLNDVLCPDACIVVANGSPVYRDRDHLSVYGATTLLGDVLAERIWGAATP